MCGFLVYVADSPIDPEVVDRMAHRLELMHHRGPDDTVLATMADHVVVGFNRLAVIDLEGSRQPLSYPPRGPEAGRWTLVFNGEVYNFEALRDELREHGAEFATGGDGEVVAAAYHRWGPSAVDRLRGMYAFVLWDSATNTVHAARDPFGIKPLHYLHGPGGLWLSSEKRALLDLAGTELDREALGLYLSLQYVPDPYTLHRYIGRLPAASRLTRQPGAAPVIARYRRPMFRPDPEADRDKIIVELREALRDSVRAHMRADVPVGTFLSSGVDSTAIVALAREHHPHLKAFTAGFDGPYSELEVAERTAKHLGVDLTPTVVEPAQVIEALPRIVWHLDDPVADPSIVPLYFLAKTAAEHVTVVLSGEGSDELTGGYTIYREPASVAPVHRLPASLQRALRALGRSFPEGVRGKSFLDRATSPIEERYFGNARVLTPDEQAALLRDGAPVRHTQVTAALYEEAMALDDVTTMQHVDVNTWLPGDILLKADRMSMAHSLELRVPFLDPRVFEVAARLPASLKVRRRVTKYALREAVRGIVPDFVVDRPKLGFPTPARQWLRGELGEWADDVLANSGAGDLIDLGYARKLLAEHRRQGIDNGRKVWLVLTFALWHAIFVEQTLTPTSPSTLRAARPA